MRFVTPVFSTGVSGSDRWAGRVRLVRKKILGRVYSTSSKHTIAHGFLDSIRAIPCCTGSRDTLNCDGLDSTAEQVPPHHVHRLDQLLHV
jgi:Zn-finger domain-containing protein